jgi:hypothetical protein
MRKPDPEPEVDPDPGVPVVLRSPRSRLGELMTVVASVGGTVLVQPRTLNEREMYVSVIIPDGRMKEFDQAMFEAAFRIP